MTRVLVVLAAVIAVMGSSGCFGGEAPNPTIANFECELCHAGDDVVHTEPQPERCVGCHANQSWLPLDHDGHDALFPITYGNHRRLDCGDCHPEPDGVFSVGCIDCHTHDRDRTDGHHGGVGGYRYESAACYDCHPTGGS